MEVVNILYKIDGENDPYPNMFQINVVKGRIILLIDILKSWSEGHPLGINYNFQASFSGTLVSLDSLTSVVPSKNGIISLLLTPSGAPPLSILENFSADNSYSTKETYYDSASANYVENLNITKSSQPNFTDTDRGKRESKYSNSEPANDRFFVSEETVSSLTEAAGEASAVAKEAAGIAARSFINFAAATVKSVKEAATTLSGQVQVGHHKVVIVREIAEGGFGKVFHVKDISTKKDYAMKQLFCQSKEQIADAQIEIDILQKLRKSSHQHPHPNLIELVDFGSSTSRQNGHRQVLLLFPLYTRGTVWNCIERTENREGEKWPIPEQRALLLVRDTARALLAIHREGFSHRDVKPHNIMLADDDSGVLMDLGSVSAARVEITSRQKALNEEELAASKTSAPYRPPELTQVPMSITIDERVDVWGLGCTMYCLAFGRSPFETTREGVLRLAILNGKYSTPQGGRMRDCVFSSGYLETIQSMLAVDHTKRPFIGGVIEKIEQLLESLRRSR